MAKHFDNGTADEAGERNRPRSTHRPIGPRITLHPQGETTVPPVQKAPAKKARRRAVKK